MTRVLLIDDHPIVLQGCRRILEAHGASEVHTASRLLQAFQIYRRTRPDVVVVDLSIARKTLAGIGFIRRLRAIDRNVPILVFSMHADPVIVRKSLAAGATGYVHKDADPAEIGHAFEKVAAGQPFIAGDLATEVALHASAARRLDTGEFTRREQEILALLAEGRSYGEIADELGVSYKTVANVCSILKSKLEAETLPDLVFKAVQRFSPPRQRR
ncbi:response regulator transcription factor [Methylobrevis albus]|uniref:Response regulator transcription factor n=1 Tax=Methylobrevis albus TaxID=2793297 RepID=A0A931I235_9HYPH|nr:response regulator transcription factor [Methylobrevis albus]MBH0237873.1 response regulator transcription factor [Methylobrevis albus]